MYSIKRLVDNYSAEDVFSDDIRKNKLLTFLLRRGYIDEKYATYINYFKGTSITKDDMNFILSVKNQEPLAFDYSLSKTPMVIQRLQDYEFEEKAIYNFGLLEQLLLEEHSTKLDTFIGQLSDGHEISWQFIDEFVSKTTYQNQFIQLLAEKWNGMWASIAANETLTYDRQLLYLQAMLNMLETSTIGSQNIDDCLTHYFEIHNDILRKLASCSNSKMIAAIGVLNIHFLTLQIAGVSRDVLDYVFDECCYKLNEAMIQTIVSYKSNDMVDQLKEQPYSTLIDLKYDILLQYIHENVVAYVRDVVFEHSALSDRAEDIVDMLIRLKNESELATQLINQERFHLDSIEECGGDLITKEKEVWHPIWKSLLEGNYISVDWKNVITYWNVYKLCDELQQYISHHVDELSLMDTAAVDDDFIRMFIEAGFENNVYRKLIPVLEMENFNLDISTIKQPILLIMVDCHYFGFTADRYVKIAEVSFEIGNAFILKNQSEFMTLKDGISMSEKLFEILILSDYFQQENKEKLFAEYAETYMTEAVASQISVLNLALTVGIFNVAWNCIEKNCRAEFLCKNCNALGADMLEQKFSELGGKYAELADRTRRHSVFLPMTELHRLLAEHLEEIDYITSKEEQMEKEYNAALKREVARNVLKLRIKQVK